MTARRCEICRFWDAQMRDHPETMEALGMCRALPPGFDERSGLAVWPKTQSYDDCGAWKPIDEEWNLNDGEIFHRK